MAATTLSINDLQKAVTAKGWKWFTDRPNLIGLRSRVHTSDQFCDTFHLAFRQPLIPGLSSLGTAAIQRALNAWAFTGEDGKPLSDDGVMGSNTRHAMDMHSLSQGSYRLLTWRFTSLPGLDYLRAPLHKDGCFILHEGQYLDAFTLGFHHQRPDHPCLRQIGKLTGTRDNDRDAIPEQDPSRLVVVGPEAGVNIHRGKKEGKTLRIGPNSAGCQVSEAADDHNLKLVPVVKSFSDFGQRAVTYSLLEERGL